MKRTYNVHKMFIYNIEHRNPETRKTLDDFLVQVRNFLLPLSLKVFRHKEREIHLTFLSAPNHVRTRHKAMASKRKSTVFFRGRTQLTFFKSPKILHTRFRCMMPFTSPSPIWDFYFDISEWHILPARAWTPALMLHRTNPCAERKVLSLTKPKGKIYKTKSLGHYITVPPVPIILVGLLDCIQCPRN